MKRTTIQANIANKIYIGIDNGVSGSIGWSGIDSNGMNIYGQLKTPIISQQNYTKTKKNVTKVHIWEMMALLEGIILMSSQTFLVVERPMVNPGRFQASLSAIRALEVVEIIINKLKIPFQYIDSGQWQRVMLPKGIKGSDELKTASLQIGKRLFPSVVCKNDADGILMAEWARRSQL